MVEALGSLYGMLFEVFSSNFSYDGYIFDICFDYAMSAFLIFVFFAITVLPFFIIYRVIDWR